MEISGFRVLSARPYNEHAQTSLSIIQSVVARVSYFGCGLPIEYELRRRAGLKMARKLHELVVSCHMQSKTAEID